ncbi:MAG: hypothetical protein R3E79_08775 [Caldilineaceae bacterium]
MTEKMMELLGDQAIDLLGHVCRGISASVLFPLIQDVYLLQEITVA